MADRIQQIVDLIDVGLQTPMPDPSFGEVSPVNSESCFRCHCSPAEGSDLCAGCRAFMLGDSEEDPARRSFAATWVPPTTWRATPSRSFVGWVPSEAEMEAFDEVVQTLVRAFGASTEETTAAVMRAMAAAFDNGLPMDDVSRCRG